MKLEDVVKIGLDIFSDAMPQAEPTPLPDCIREQEWSSVEEREHTMKEIAEWLDEQEVDHV
mgnify:CR=1 FL=1